MALVLETSRLILRSFEERDTELFAQYRSDPSIAQYQSWNIPYSIEQAERFVNALMSSMPGLPGEWYQLAIEPKKVGKIVGDCAFVILNHDARQAEIGFTVAREYQKLGYATEAVTGLLDYLFSTQRMHRVRANCDPRNNASVALMKRVGMRHEGHFIKSLWFKGEWADEDWFAILEEEWQSQRPSP